MRPHQGAALFAGGFQHVSPTYCFVFLLVLAIPFFVFSTAVPFCPRYFWPTQNLMHHMQFSEAAATMSYHFQTFQLMPCHVWRVDG